MSTTVFAASTSAPVIGLLSGGERSGVSLGRGYLLFDDVVLALTPRGAPRMPNGIECDVEPPAGTAARIVAGALEVGTMRILPGPPWDPVPSTRVRPRSRVAYVPDPERLGGRGPGLTPAGDDLLAGYAAGLVLFHGKAADARAIASVAAVRTTTLSATLLRHAARGELPEPAHALLERGDARPLLAWGGTSGRYLMLGLALAAERPAAQDRLTCDGGFPGTAYKDPLAGRRREEAQALRRAAEASLRA